MQTANDNSQDRLICIVASSLLQRLDSSTVTSKNTSSSGLRPGRDTDHLPPISAEVQNGGAIISTLTFTLKL
jgi:hypothetical protein